MTTNASLLSQSVKSDTPQTPETSPEVHNGSATHAAQGQGYAQATATSQAQQHDWEKRYKDLQSYKDQQIRDLQTQLSQVRQSASTPITEEQALSNPDIAALIQRQVETQVELARQSLDQTQATMLEDVRSLSKQNAMDRLRQAHPDLDTILSDPKFTEWGHSASPLMRQALESPVEHTETAIDAIRYYKLQTQGQTSGVTSFVDGQVPSVPTTAQAPISAQGPVILESQIQRMVETGGPQALVPHMAEIQKAQAEGRYIDDTKTT